MTVFQLATIGGLISFASTSLGAVLSFFSEKLAKSNRWSLSVDFALGLMVSASAFTLIGPAALEVLSSIRAFSAIVMAAFLGLIFVYLLKEWIETLESTKHFKPSQLILATVLMLHNYPEGLASGSALAGLSLQNALPILGGIALQNVPEGALMVMALRAMGWSRNSAFLGGILSALVELLGGITAGLLLQFVTGALPYLLSFAGGSMMASVIIEMKSGDLPVWKRILSRPFAIGFLCLPLIQFIKFN